MTATATLSPEQMLTILADGGEHLRESLLAQLQRMANEGGSALLTGLREALVKVLSADSHHRVDDEEHSGSWTRSWQVSALVIVAGDDAAARRLMELYSDRAQEPNRWIRYWTLATANGRKEHAAWVRQRADALARDEGEHLMLRCLGWALGAELDDNSEALAALQWALAGGQGPFPCAQRYTCAPGDPAAAVLARSAALRALRVVPLAQCGMVVTEPSASFTRTWNCL